MTIVLDLETDNLWPNVTKIHCAVAIDVDSGVIIKFVPDYVEIPEEQIGGHEFLFHIKMLPGYLERNCGAWKQGLSCHNGTSFDLKVLKKILNYEYKGEYFDTLLASRVLWPDIVGGHSVEEWAQRFGMHKPKHEDWSEFSEEMLFRCTEDAKIQVELYKHIQKYIKEMQENDPRIDFDKVFRLEHKTWGIIEKACDNGWKFDLENGYKSLDWLTAEKENIDKKLIPSLPLRVIKPKTEVTKAFKAGGGITEVAKKWVAGFNLQEKCKDFRKEYPQLSCWSGEVCGDFCKVQFEEMNLGSPEQMKQYLLAAGWEPWFWNYEKGEFNKDKKDKFGNKIKKSPKLPKEEEEWDAAAKLTGNENIKMISYRNKVKHRIGVIKGWIENTTKDFRIHPEYNTCGTNTSRMKQYIIVNPPKANGKKFFGKEMRSLLTADDGEVMVGADATSLEAFIAAHYLYFICPETSKIWTSGKIHDDNAIVWDCSRDDAKTALYLLIFGGSALKLAITLGRPISQAKELYNNFWKANPVLQEFKAKAEEQFKIKGYVIGLDSRPLTIRYQHATVSSLFQSGGAIQMKTSLCVFDKQLEIRNLKAKLLGMYHDEFQTSVKPEIAEEVGKLAVWSMEEASRVLKLNVTVSGEYKIGKNWCETH